MGHEAVERFTLEVEQALTCPLSAAARVASPARIALVLYLSDSMPSRRTRRTVQMVLDEYDRMQVVILDQAGVERVPVLLPHQTP